MVEDLAAAEPLRVLLPPAPGGEAHQLDLEAVLVERAGTVTTEGVTIDRDTKERLDRFPDDCLHFGVTCAQDR